MSDIFGSYWQGGPSPGMFYNFPGQCDYEVHQQSDERKRTSQPSVTGTSVLGLVFNGGVIVAADTLGSYGSMARFRNLSRIMKVNDTTVLSAAGDYADYQYIKSEIDQMVIDDQVMDDGFQMSPKAILSWMTRVLYSRRSKFDPLWTTITVAGVQDGKGYLGTVDKIGICYKDQSVASGFGAHLARPLMRKALENREDGLSEEDAREVIEQCLKVLYYRDARSYNRHEIAIVTENGVVIEKPKASDTNWGIAHVVKGF